MLKSLISYQTISLLAREMFNVMVQKIGSLEIQFPAAVDVKVLRLRLLLHISKAFAFSGDALLKHSTLGCNQCSRSRCQI